MAQREVRVFETYRFYDEEIASRVDPATAGQYAEERDASKLGLPAEARPVLFRCRVLSRTQRNRLSDVANETTKLQMAFRFGLLEIRNIPTANGELTSWVPQRAKEDGQIDDAALDALEDLGFGDVDIWEIGSVVVAHSFLARGAPAYSPQLRSSQLAWVATRSKFPAAPKTAT